MTNVEVAELELRLTAGYEKLIDSYRRVMDVLERNSPASSIELQNVDWTEELNAILGETGIIDAAIAQDRLDWQKANRSAGGQLRDTLIRVGDELQSLIERINLAIRNFQDRRRQSTPELEGFVRQRQMIQAYATATGTSKRV